MKQEDKRKLERLKRIQEYQNQYNKEHYKRYTLSLVPELSNKLEALAQASGCSPCDVLRQMIRDAETPEPEQFRLDL